MEIQTLLSNLGFDKETSEDDFNEGFPSLAFVNIVSWLSLQLNKLNELESYVTNVTDLEDSLGFLVEVSSLLKELGCPYKSLTEGEITGRLIHSENKKLLITYLCSELQAAKILAVKNPVVKPKMQIELEESKTAKELKDMLVSLRFARPPDTITPQQLFGEVEKKLKHLCHPSTPKEKVGQLLFTGCLTEKQWFQLDHLYKDMYQEYKTRKNLLLTRMDVTIKSFLWADRLKSKCDQIMDMYNKRKSNIPREPSVNLSHVLAATADLAIIEKTSCASVRKNISSRVYKEIIGTVPDRGGRPEEQQPPPPEVPSWQKNDSSSRGGFKQSNPPPSGNAGYRDNAGYNKSSSYSRDENSNSRAPMDNYNYNKGSNYKGGRNDYNSAPPMYQSVNYCAQLQNPQFGFGGYVPAGDNFQQYGIGDGMNQMNQYQQHRGGNRGSGHRSRGGYSGSNQSRGGRGQRGGRGHF